jgi:hypothetical protein
MCNPKVDTSYQDFSISEAGRARAEEEARQLRIKEGMDHIRAVFEGGEYAAPEQMPGFRNLYGDDDNYKNDEWVVDTVTGRLAPTPYAGMNPVLAQRDAALRGYYFPQLDREKGRAQDDLTYALSRAGLLNSTAAGTKQADLMNAYAMERGKILSNIASDLSGTKTRMNQSRAAIEAGLRASGDASQAAQQALSSAVTFREDMPTLNPISNIFYGLASGIGAARQGAEADRIRRAATFDPIRTTSYRNVV